MYIHAVALSALLFSLHASELSTGVVRVEGGAIQGAASSNAGVHVFKGIPYAAPPVGDLRWKEPQPVPEWAGIRSAEKFGPRCMQAPVPLMIFRDSGSSEDCLYLNVWTPAKSQKESLPVMFWIHGGAFLMGGTSEPKHDGEALAARGVVVVTVGYRLGVFGFLAHPDLTSESPHHASGNYGLLDQWTALGWVRRNIKAFGGDPKRVTIFGESAGSFSVSALLASPLTREWIHAAIGESGAFFGPTFETASLRSAEQQGAKFAESQSSGLKSLRAEPAAKLLAASLKLGGIPFTPIVDGYFLPAPLTDLYTAGKQSHVSILAGWNSDEMPWEVLAAKEKITPDRLSAQFHQKFASHAEAVQRAYAAANDDEAAQAARDFASDEFIGYGSWKWIDLHASTSGKPVYRYLFTRVRPSTPEMKFGPVKMSDLKAYHGSEIEYVFGSLDSAKEFPWQPEDHQLSELMQAYWTNFAKTGDPNGPDLPKWGPYKHVMVLDVDARSVPETHRDRYEALDGFYSSRAGQ